MVTAPLATVSGLLVATKGSIEIAFSPVDVDLTGANPARDLQPRPPGGSPYGIDMTFISGSRARTQLERPILEQGEVLSI